MNPKILFVVGVIGAVVVVGAALSSMGGDAAKPQRHYRGRGTATATTPAGTATAVPGGTSLPKTVSNGVSGGPVQPGPATPAAGVGGAEGRRFRPGETHGATKEDAAKGATPIKPPAGSTGAAATYTVAAKGESIYAVAQKMLGDAMRWREVYEANRAAVEDPDRIPGGTVLRMPDGAAGERVKKVPGIGDGID